MEKSTKSLALNWGLYLGVLLTLSTILGYINLDLFTKMWYGIILLIAVIVFGVISAVKSKKLLGGYISFKDAFTSFFITVSVGLAISTIVSIIIFNFIDPEAAIVLKEKMMNSQVEMMRNFGAPQEAIEQAVEKLEAEENMFSITNVVQNFIFQLIGYIIVGLIAALVIKKNNPEEA
ncbi:DUF4199 domain-containing protein [Neotamlana laminarinivorans]|uniref:DUF4199 domain-containing protein n=1 Tax=Neotamlana laminarinivorans TaxID=2883124 RepID=A0A9X1I2F9_9FLAO|nr:DUF4199 domain-containing protein [Tamlana laminarinivorans]MCB4798744.1 DUF4199 domain-containing protein [Tamlana laminarinivorans]